MYFNNNWAVVIPMANEEKDLDPFVSLLKEVLKKLGSGKVYFVVDKVSKDQTLALCQAISNLDERFETIWCPENRNVVDAYLNGYRTALAFGHTFIIEMDAGLSHDPRALPMFLRVLNEGNECAFGSRFINGGSMADSAFKRWFLSRFGTLLANFFLGTRLKDMTSGYQGFHKDIVKLFVHYPFKSTGHFYQTELRYLLRNKRFMEVPIHYRAPSPNVNKNSIKNSRNALLHYTFNRLFGRKTCL